METLKSSGKLTPDLKADLMKSLGAIQKQMTDHLKEKKEKAEQTQKRIEEAETEAKIEETKAQKPDEEITVGEDGGNKKVVNGLEEAKVAAGENEETRNLNEDVNDDDADEVICCSVDSTY